MKKTEAIRRARLSIPPPVCLNPAHFLLRVPADVGEPDGKSVEVQAASYIDAQHARAYAICRVALVYMGLRHIALSTQDGGTVEQLMSKALARAEESDESGSAIPFWQVRLGTEGPQHG